MESAKDEVNSLIHKMASKMHTAYVSYHVWKWLEQARNLNIGEEKANRNVGIMNQQPNFFHVALQGAFYNFILDLSVFFDTQKPALSLGKLMSRTDMSPENRAKIDDILMKHDKVIQQIKRKIRDKEVAHFDTNLDRSQPNVLLYKEVEELFTAVYEVFNILSQSFNNEFWMADDVSELVNHEMGYLLDNLERGEKRRIEDINRKYPIPGDGATAE